MPSALVSCWSGLYVSGQLSRVMEAVLKRSPSGSVAWAQASPTESVLKFSWLGL